MKPELIEKWLVSKGYRKANDGTWMIDGYEIDLIEVLNEFSQHIHVTDSKGSDEDVA